MRKILLAVLFALSSSAYSQGTPRFLAIPAGQQIVLKAETQDVPLGPLFVPFTKGWSFYSQGRVFAGRAPDEQLRFEATFAYEAKAMTARVEQDKFTAFNRQQLPGFQSEFVAAFGKADQPCFDSPQPDGRFRFICTATRQRDGRNEHLIAYAYVGKWAILFLNFYGEGDSAAGFKRAEDILANARWDDIMEFKQK